MRSSASSLNFQYPLVSQRSSSSCSRLLPRLPITCSPPSMFPSITYSRRQFVRKTWTKPFSLFLSISCTVFLSSLTDTVAGIVWLRNTLNNHWRKVVNGSDTRYGHIFCFKVTTFFMFFRPCIIADTEISTRRWHFWSKLTIHPSYFHMNKCIYRIFIVTMNSF